MDSRQEAADALVLAWASTVKGRPSLRELADLAGRIVAAPAPLPERKVVAGLLPPPAPTRRKKSKPGAGKCHGAPGCTRPVKYPRMQLCQNCYQKQWAASRGGKPKRALKARKNADGEPRRNPVELEREAAAGDNPGAYKDLRCAHYQQCLTYATKRRWRGLSCQKCALANLEKTA